MMLKTSPCKEWLLYGPNIGIGKIYYMGPRPVLALQLI